jgi:predicted ATP-grasp superfamily ATP-dependent carboligase
MHSAVSHPHQRPVRAPRALLLVEQRHWLAAASLPPLLRDAGLRVDVICRPGSLIAKSRFVDTLHLVDGDEAGYFSAVRRFLEASAAYAWVVPVTDTDVRGLAQRIEEPWAQAIFPARRTAEVVEAMIRKPAMDQLLVRAGIPIPASAPVANETELVGFGAAHGWPVMLKPVDGVGGGGVVRVQEPGFAHAAIAGVTTAYPSLMAQAYVPGPIASCQVIFDRGRPLAWATSYKVRTWPGPYGPSSAISFAPIPGVAELLPPIGEALGFHGALTVDMIVDERSGSPVVIEVNVRPAGIMGRGRRAGVDFASAVRQMLFGIPSKAHTRGTRHRVTAGLYPQDLVRCFEEGEFAPLRDWLGMATLADLPWTDPGVLLSSTRFLLSHLVRRT